MEKSSFQTWSKEGHCTETGNKSMTAQQALQKRGDLDKQPAGVAIELGAGITTRIIQETIHIAIFLRPKTRNMREE